MASGCIFGDCIKCGEHVWEDDNFTFDQHDRLTHNGCRTDWQARANLLQKELNVWIGYSNHRSMYFPMLIIMHLLNTL